MISIAHAAGQPAPPGAAGMAQFVPLILIFVIFYFLLIRPQQKKAKEHEAFLNSLRKGDQVVTSGGIFGKVAGLTDAVVTLEVDNGVRIKVTRNSIMMSADAAKQQAAPAPAPKGGG